MAHRAQVSGALSYIYLYTHSHEDSRIIILLEEGAWDYPGETTVCPTDRNSNFQSRSRTQNRQRHHQRNIRQKEIMYGNYFGITWRLSRHSLY